MKGKKVKGYMKGGDIGDSMPGIEGLDKKFGKSVADANKAAGDATAKRIKDAKDHQLDCKVDGVGEMMVTAHFVKKA